MKKDLSQKLDKLPKKPGVYFHKNSSGEIIYIGKAAILKNRVRQYFQKGRLTDAKTTALVSEIADIEWIEVDSEVDALFLEAELVRRYLPAYNVLLRDDKSQLYVRIDVKSDYPTVTTLRRPLDDGAEYFGPYLNGFALKRALRYLRRAFPYAIAKPSSAKKSRLYYQLGLDPGLAEGKTSLPAYRQNLRQLIKYLKGQRLSLVRDLEKRMHEAAKRQDFESAVKYRNQLKTLEQLQRKVIFSDREFLDASKDKALNGLSELLNLPKPPIRIEGYDISHIQGSSVVASMVCFRYGLPEKSQYRKFKLSAGNDDFLHMKEVISRRFSPSNLKKWPPPDLILIDGGKGQLSAAKAALTARSIEAPAVGLAKKEEEIILMSKGADKTFSQGYLTSVGGFERQASGNFVSLLLPTNSDIVKLLQRIRDESHRFAVAYHSSLRKSQMTKNLLEDLPGVGPATRKKLIRHFGSLRGLKATTRSELSQLVGAQKAASLAAALKLPD